MKQTKKVHVYLTPEVKEKLQRIAQSQGRTLSEVIREGIAEVLKKYEKILREEEDEKDKVLR